MILDSFKDIGLHTYTYYWIDSDKKVISPFFESSKLANKWFLANHGYSGLKSDINLAAKRDLFDSVTI